MKRRLGVAALLALLAGWWFWGADWFARPRTYRLSVLYIVVVLASGGLHARALYKFWGMVRSIRVAEHMGDLDPGSTAYANNQRFRYMVRMIESLVVLTVGVTTVVAVRHPGVELNKNFARLVLTYFVGSVAATGYLTWRDIMVYKVMNAKRVAAEEKHD